MNVSHGVSLVGALLVGFLLGFLLRPASGAWWHFDHIGEQPIRTDLRTGKLEVVYAGAWRSTEEASRIRADQEAAEECRRTATAENNARRAQDGLPPLSR